MIERVAICDYQTHHRLVVEFSPTVTTLFGPSDVGKSTVLRALQWVMTNRPLGVDMIGDWGRAAYALVTINVDGHAVARRRGSGVNAYRLDRNRPWPAMGAGVPAPVAQLLNVGTVNFQGQHDGPFWFALPAPEVSRRLNNIINLGEIDDALGNAAAGVRRAKTAVEVAETRLADAERERDALAWARPALAAVRDARTLAAKHADAASKAASLASLSADMAGAMKTAEDAGRAAAAMAVAADLAQKWNAADRRARSLGQLAADIAAAERDAAVTPPDLSGVEEMVERHDRAARTAHGLNSLWLWLTSALDDVARTERELKWLETKIRAAGGRCPACGQPIQPRSPSPWRSETSTGTGDGRPRGLTPTGTKP